MAGKDMGMPAIVGGIVQQRRLGETNAVNQENPQQCRYANRCNAALSAECEIL